jgi:hypothetical protein
MVVAYRFHREQLTDLDEGWNIFAGTEPSERLPEVAQLPEAIVVRD